MVFSNASCTCYQFWLIRSLSSSNSNEVAINVTGFRGLTAYNKLLLGLELTVVGVVLLSTSGPIMHEYTV